MSMKIVRLGSLLFACVLAASAFCFEFPALAGNVGQNTNSSTTVAENSNAATPSRRKGRRSRRRAAATAADTSSMPAATSADSAAMPDTSQTVASAPTEQTDLSGTYTGTLDCSDAGVSGDTTLTITGNQFTLTDGKTGRIVASTTHGYTGVAMQFGEATAATGTQAATVPTIVSMRAKKVGDRLTLMPVEGSGHVCSFKPAAASRSARTRRTRTRAMPAQPAEPATPAEPMVTPATPAEPATPADNAGPMPPATPTPVRRGRRGRRGNTNTNSNTSTNDNTGEGNANARPTPTPPTPRY
jgi:hypothetical protein